MAYRRRQGLSRASTFKEEISHSPSSDSDNHLPNDTLSASSSLAAQAIKAHRESSLSSAYAANSIPQSFRSNKVFGAHEDSSSSLAGRIDWTSSSSVSSSTSSNSSAGFWGVVARKAKSILDEEAEPHDHDHPHPSSASSSRFLMPDTSPSPSFHQSYLNIEGFKKMDNPTLRKGLDKITSSLNHIGDTFEKAFEEGRTIVESKTADIIQETRKLHVMRKGGSPEAQNQFAAANSPWQPLGQPTQPQNQMTHETQLKASRDVAMATAAKAKLLLRELKTVKADLAFAKQRCSQLEEENKILRDSREKGGNPADDDLIRLQLETLLAEKARLAHENSVYARENRFLREIVEYHQLTMQDVVYLDEGSEEVTEVYPYTKMLSKSPPSPMSPPSPSDIDLPANLLVTKEIITVPGSVEEMQEEVPSSDVQTKSLACIPEEKPTIIQPATEEEHASKHALKGII